MILLELPNTTGYRRIMEPLTFAEWLRRARTERGFTMRRLAEESDLSHAHISKLEGDTAKPSRDAVQRLVTALGGETGLNGQMLAIALNLAGFATGPGKPKWFVAESPNPYFAESEVPPFDEWPESLKESVRLTFSSMSPEAREQIFKLWQMQAQAHAKIADLTKEAEAEYRAKQDERAA